MSTTTTATADRTVRVHVYGSSVSGNRKIKDAQARIHTVFTTQDIPYEFVDLAADEEGKLYMRRKNGGATELPQIFVDGEFRGTYTAFDDAVEYDELDSFLAFDKPKEDEALLREGQSVDDAALAQLLEEDAQRDQQQQQ
ncbi:SH3-binding, glutamic acid-rich protein-domain-containing protein [Syncephalis pseudoplumigaleata]|uniref:SH3-binding, glutamic acid-rich protein-domain-containing protein n=1 Tax=Syncephalis pseudoplumigaleata TaxID=1712513 RepID=A0A4P9Z1J5_9FUNG|nr:SH3-binding, glutamic acid-rich protein-domain-containing protein [Syncephalis pseudoplumigaleata]|eukprot:RKP26195.1 SH3-binding, glutamic acid-rich protein-domain-containing protein [Syncephalis pseudoplumigaleata]